MIASGEGPSFSCEGLILLGGLASSDPKYLGVWGSAPIILNLRAQRTIGSERQKKAYLVRARMPCSMPLRVIGAMRSSNSSRIMPMEWV